MVRGTLFVVKVMRGLLLIRMLSCRCCCCGWPAGPAVAESEEPEIEKAVAAAALLL